MKKVFLVIYDNYEFSPSDEAFGDMFDGYCIASTPTEKYPDGIVMVDDYIEEFEEELKTSYPDVYKDFKDRLESYGKHHMRVTYHLKEVLDRRIDEGQILKEGVYKLVSDYLPVISLSKESAEKYMEGVSKNYKAHQNLRVIEVDNLEFLD